MLTSTQMIVGELMPKSFALRHPERTARFTARPVEITARIFHPFVALMNGIGLGVVRLLGFKGTADSHHPVLPAEELMTLVKSSAQAGLLPADPRIMSRFLNFSDLRAQDLMVPRVDIIALNATASLAEVLDVARAHQHERYPVYEESLDHIVGVINVKDLLASGVRRESGTSVSWKRSVRKMPILPASAPVESLLSLLNRMEAQMALLVDEYGATEGIVTIADISAQLISGPDEVVREADGCFLIEGHAPIGVVEDELGIDLDPGDAHVETIAGLVIASTGDFPETGAVVEVNRHSLEVVEIDGHRITSVRLCIAPPLDTDDESQRAPED
jgi:CBS domain containing-hemolysin-like protein